LQLETYKIIDISGVIKKYFKELPDPLITDTMFTQLKTIEKMKDFQDWDDVKIVQDVLQQVRREKILRIYKFDNNIGISLTVRILGRKFECQYFGPIIIL
jgi:hypothetical protein